ncbi:MAG: hypothetical protein AAFV80_12325 [Bacteroidota bacterium]
MKLNTSFRWTIMVLFVLGAFSFMVPTTFQTTDHATPRKGSVVGKITYDGSVPKLKPINMSSDPGCATLTDGKVRNQGLVLGDGNCLGNVFVQIKNAPVTRAAKNTAPVEMELKGCMIEPRVVGVQAGQALTFINTDNLVYQLTGKPKNNPAFKLPLSPRVGEQTLFFDEADAIFGVKCDVHPWVSGYVAVMTHPYFMVTDVDGRFEFKNLPNGTYEIEATHERLGTISGKVNIKDGQQRMDLVFEREGRK